jgi:hypothetical protein
MVHYISPSDRKLNADKMFKDTSKQCCGPYLTCDLDTTRVGGGALSDILYRVSWEEVARLKEITSFKSRHFE